MDMHALLLENVCQVNIKNAANIRSFEFLSEKFKVCRIYA
jgi:hypothetical protein